MEPLLERRVELSNQVGEILADPVRYNSPEFDQCVREIGDVDRQIRNKGIDSSPLFKLIAGTVRLDEEVALD